jgi:hypothetical protein
VTREEGAGVTSAGRDFSTPNDTTPTSLSRDPTPSGRPEGRGEVS